MNANNTPLGPTILTDGSTAAAIQRRSGAIRILAADGAAALSVFDQLLKQAEDLQAEEGLEDISNRRSSAPSANSWAADSEGPADPQASQALEFQAGTLPMPMPVSPTTAASAHPSLIMSTLEASRPVTQMKLTDTDARIKTGDPVNTLPGPAEHQVSRPEASIRIEGSDLVTGPALVDHAGERSSGVVSSASDIVIDSIALQTGSWGNNQSSGLGPNPIADESTAAQAGTITAGRADRSVLSTTAHGAGLSTAGAVVIKSTARDGLENKAARPSLATAQSALGPASPRVDGGIAESEITESAISKPTAASTSASAQPLPTTQQGATALLADTPVPAPPSPATPNIPVHTPPDTATDWIPPGFNGERLNTSMTDEAFPRVLGMKIGQWTQDGIQRVWLDVHPADMGPVAIQIALDGRQAELNFGVESAAARQVIESSLPNLAAALQSAGLTLTGGSIAQNLPQSRPGHDETPNTSGSYRRDDGGSGPTPVSPSMIRRPAQGLVDLYA